MPIFRAIVKRTVQTKSQPSDDGGLLELHLAQSCLRGIARRWHATEAELASQERIDSMELRLLQLAGCSPAMTEGRR
jgi:hypothetical protein